MLSQAVPETFLILPDVETRLESLIATPRDAADALTPDGRVRHDRGDAAQLPASQIQHTQIDLVFGSSRYGWLVDEVF